MKNFYVKNVSDDVIYASGLLGSNLYDIINDAYDYLLINNNKAIILGDMNGVDLTITRDMSKQDARKLFEKKYTEYKEKLRREREEYEKSPKGIEERLIKEAKLKRENEYRYHSAQEAIEAIKAINQKVDFVNGKTPINEAVEFCKKVMIIISKCDYINFEAKEIHEFREALKEKGACGDANASLVYKTSNEQYIGKLMEIKNNIQFPLSAFSQLIDYSDSSFNYSIKLLSEGGEEYSWASKWINAQQQEQTENHDEQM